MVDHNGEIRLANAVQNEQKEPERGVSKYLDLVADNGNKKLVTITVTF